jgi:hypothetical protein
MPRVSNHEAIEYQVMIPPKRIIMLKGAASIP